MPFFALVALKELQSNLHYLAKMSSTISFFLFATSANIEYNEINKASSLFKVLCL